ncbi:hypothetical protein HID58_057048 [Brassica napus]|uniref:F-box associated beta-propeller type 3 domain-containing protein n=1 Tax=Brassica napus TaxID=3708 RepID=A0ABQ8AQ00_BRANA|nr:hypothetical protein HID58_057048 [Brassica napus]
MIWGIILINDKGKLYVVGRNVMMMLTYVGSRGCWETYMVKYTLYNLPKDLVDWKVWVFGVTTTDEIIMATTCNFTSELFYVFYFNPERKTFQTVEVQVTCMS